MVCANFVAKGIYRGVIAALLEFTQFLNVTFPYS